MPRTKRPELSAVAQSYLSVNTGALDAVAEQFGVHRATAFRWVEKARAAGMLPVNETVAARRKARQAKNYAQEVATKALGKLIWEGVKASGGWVTPTGANAVAFEMLAHGWRPPTNAPRKATD